MALSGNFETENEREEAIDTLRAAVPFESMIFTGCCVICIGYFFTDASYWMHWVALGAFIILGIKSGGLAWKARASLKRLESKPEQDGAGQPDNHPEKP